MILFIHLQIKAISEIEFESHWVKSVKTHFPQAVVFEADNHSDSNVIQQGTNFLTEASKVVLMLESSPNEKPGKAALIIEKVLRSKNHSPLIISNGENALIEKMAKVSKKEIFVFKELSEGISKIEEHLKN